MLNMGTFIFTTFDYLLGHRFWIKILQIIPENKDCSLVKMLPSLMFHHFFVRDYRFKSGFKLIQQVPCWPW